MITTIAIEEKKFKDITEMLEHYREGQNGELARIIIYGDGSSGIEIKRVSSKETPNEWESVRYFNSLAELEKAMTCKIHILGRV